MPSEIRFELGRQFTTAYLTDGASLSAVEAYALALRPYTHAALTYCSIVQSKALNDQADTGGTWNNLDFVVKVFIRAETGGERRMIPINAPVDSMLEAAPNGAKRVKTTVGQHLAEIYSQFTNKRYIFEQGYLCGSADTLP